MFRQAFFFLIPAATFTACPVFSFATTGRSFISQSARRTAALSPFARATTTTTLNMSSNDDSSSPAKFLWKCGCGQVQFEMTSDPYFILDCHCSACTPISKYLDEKSNGKGTSAMVHETGVAKAFFLLDQVKFIQGQDKIAGVKLGEDGKNVRAYTTCCHTLVIGDSPVPFPFRPFNRNALYNASDGSAYVPAEPAWGMKGGDNPWYERVPEPKHPGDPDWLIAKVEKAESVGTVGDFAGDTSPGFFPDPDKITEFVPKP